MSSFVEVTPDLAAIEAAERRIRDRVAESPLLAAPDLSSLLGEPVWLKGENLQPTGSFKVRGATNWIRTATEAELRNGLVTVSAGNHALALAWAAAPREIPVTVVMPEGSSPMKIERTRELGAEVIVHGNIQQAVARCWELRNERRLTLVHPYNDTRIMAGQGTVGLEVIRQLPELTRVICPIGGGGLISGVGLALKAMRPEVQVIGVEPEGAPTMRNAWDRKNPDAALESVSTIAASLAPAVVGHNTYRVSRQVVDDIVTVADRTIAEATRLMLTSGHIYAETGAAVGLAALLEGKLSDERPHRTVLVITGGNMDLSQLAQLIEDR